MSEKIEQSAELLANWIKSGAYDVCEVPVVEGVHLRCGADVTPKLNTVKITYSLERIAGQPLGFELVGRGTHDMVGDVAANALAVLGGAVSLLLH